MPDTSDPTVPTSRPVLRLIGVYDAEGTFVGELFYWIGARLGRVHCSLCEITHGSVRAKPRWTACRAALAVPFDTYHRNDQPDRVRNVVAGRFPAVLAETEGEVVLLLGPDDLAACGGSLTAMLDALGSAAPAVGLDLDLTVERDPRPD